MNKKFAFVMMLFLIIGSPSCTHENLPETEEEFFINWTTSQVEEFFGDSATSQEVEELSVDPPPSQEEEEEVDPYSVNN